MLILTSSVIKASTSMKKLYLSELAFILLSLLTQVRSESYNASFGRACSVSNNRLAPDTNQFLSDCGYAAWCDPSTNTCQKNGCRKDEYPFGMGPKSVSSEKRDRRVQVA